MPGARQSEVVAKMEIDTAALVSSKDLPPREGEGDRENFYLTTAINYTNGEVVSWPCMRPPATSYPIGGQGVPQRRGNVSISTSTQCLGWTRCGVVSNQSTHVHKSPRSINVRVFSYDPLHYVVECDPSGASVRFCPRESHVPMREEALMLKRFYEGLGDSERAEGSSIGVPCPRSLIRPPHPTRNTRA